MNEKTPETTPEPPRAGPERKPWTPRVHGDLALNTNPFESFDQTGSSPLDGASVTRTVPIRDATQDTAPLQGSKDVSDDDYLDDGV